MTPEEYYASIDWSKGIVTVLDEAPTLAAFIYIWDRTSDETRSYSEMQQAQARAKDRFQPEPRTSATPSTPVATMRLCEAKLVELEMLLVGNNRYSAGAVATIVEALPALLAQARTALPTVPAAAPVAQSGWVSCADRLPEPGVEVIVRHSERPDPRKTNCMVASLVTKHPNASTDEPGFLDNYNNTWLASRFTSWMPLPC